MPQRKAGPQGAARLHPSPFSSPHRAAWRTRAPTAIAGLPARLSEHEILRVQSVEAGEPDREIGVCVAVDVALHEGQVVRGAGRIELEIAQFARDMVERLRGDELEVLVAEFQLVGVDRAQIDQISRPEILD